MLRAEEDPAVEAWCAAVQAKHEREKADRMAAASAHGYWLEDSDPAGLASAAAEQARESRLNAEQETPMERLIAEAKAAGKPVDPTGLPLMLLLGEVQALMQERHRKYGPGNIAEFGPLGILVRMADKFARLKAGHENFSDETVANTLDDIIGYAAIWKLWLSGDWPGSDGR